MADGIEAQSPARKLAESLVADVSGLVSPPDVCLKVTELLRSPNASSDDFGEVIIRDPNLTARLLRLVNSGFFNLRTKVDTVSRAVTLLGTQQLYDLVIAVSAVKSFSSISNQLVNMDTFWRHSIYTALIARNLAGRSDVLHPERLFIAGLLHDIGSLVLYSRLPEIARDVLMIADGDEEVLFETERQEIGFTHADLGAMLLQQWELPEALQSAVQWHHEPNKADHSQLEAAIIHTANVLANRSGIGGYCEQPNNLSAIDPDALGLLGLGSDFDEDSVIGEAGLQFTDTVGALAA